MTGMTEGAIMTVDDSELAEIDPFAALDAEAARLDRHFSSLDESGWQRPSRCEGWTTREMLSHLMGVEEYGQACLAEDIPSFMAKAAESGATSLDSFNDWVNRSHAASSTEKLLAEWRQLSADYRSQLRERGREGKIATTVGPYPVGWQAIHIASELATHADDIGVSVDPSEQATRLDWRARLSRFAIAEAQREVEIETENGRNNIRVGNATAVLSDADLVEAAAGRLDPSYAIPPAIRDALRAVP